MWVKRTEFEIAEERRRQRRSRLRAAALFGVFVTLMTALTFGSREIEGRHRFTVPTSEILSRLPFSTVFGAVAAFAIYKFQRQRPTMICPECEATKHDDGISQCSCGGHFEMMESMKYVA
jgi:hypothetical protein